MTSLASNVFIPLTDPGDLIYLIDLAKLIKTPEHLYLNCITLWCMMQPININPHPSNSAHRHIIH